MSDAGEELVLGIDVGGTYTRAVAVSLAGRILGRAERQAGNPRTTSERASRDAVLAAVHAVRDQARGRVRHVTLGIAGLIMAGEADERTRWRELIGADNVLVDSDARIAHAAAFGRAPGVCVVAGTGSQCLAFGPSGERVRVGGWGPRFGDEGSAYWIARRAIASALHDMDRAEETSMLRTLAAYAGVAMGAPPSERTRRLVNVLYDPALPLGHHARFAEEVGRLAGEGDAGAAALLAEAGRQLAEQALVAGARAGTARVAGSGGVLRGNAEVRRSFEAALRDRGAEPVTPWTTPELGAAYLSLVALGVDADACAAGWG
ncbi:MAG: ROK family protein [Trueperaceae bacterium]|nr:ROK family protein [Trueperaceae bacterium]